VVASLLGAVVPWLVSWLVVAFQIAFEVACHGWWLLLSKWRAMVPMLVG